MGAIAGIDHVIVGVDNLETAREQWRRLGFMLSPRGRHIGQPTGNYCVMFASDYIELLGCLDSGGVDHPGGNLPAWREGPMGVAFAPAGSSDDAREALLRRGLHPSGTRPLARFVELAEGPIHAHFSLISLPPEETPGLECFLCSHLTPDLIRQPEWLVHPNGATEIKAVHVLVENTAPLLAAYDRLFGIVQVTTTDAVASVRVGRHRLVFSTPDDFQTMHPVVELGRTFTLPGIVALEAGIKQRAAAIDYFTRQPVAFQEMPDGSLVVPAPETNGAVLIFSES
jgi:hypothetical protein